LIVIALITALISTFMQGDVFLGFHFSPVGAAMIAMVRTNDQDEGPPGFRLRF
jgi:hypothetical protein